MTSQNNPGNGPVRRRMAGYTPLAASSVEGAPSADHRQQPPKMPQPHQGVAPEPEAQTMTSTQDGQPAADRVQSVTSEQQTPARKQQAPVASASPKRKRRMGGAATPLAASKQASAPAASTAAETTSSASAHASAEPDEVNAARAATTRRGDAPVARTRLGGVAAPSEGSAAREAPAKTRLSAAGPPKKRMDGPAAQVPASSGEGGSAGRRPHVRG